MCIKKLEEVYLWTRHQHKKGSPLDITVITTLNWTPDRRNASSWFFRTTTRAKVSQKSRIYWKGWTFRRRKIKRSGASRPLPTFYPTRIIWAPKNIRRSSNRIFLEEYSNEKRNRPSPPVLKTVDFHTSSRGWLYPVFETVFTPLNKGGKKHRGG